MLFGNLDISYHKSLLVSLISVSFHAYPAELCAVRAPYGIGIVTSLHVDDLAFSSCYIIKVDLGICRECVFLSGKLAA